MKRQNRKNNKKNCLLKCCAYSEKGARRAEDKGRVSSANDDSGEEKIGFGGAAADAAVVDFDDCHCPATTSKRRSFSFSAHLCLQRHLCFKWKSNDFK